MADDFLRANEDFVGHRVQQIKQLFFLLPRVDLGQEYLCLDFLLDVKDGLEQKVAQNSYRNVGSEIKIWVRSLRLVHNKAIRHQISHASHNEVEKEV